MKTTTIISAALFSVTALSTSAYAQNEPLVPGSDASQTAVEEQSRDNVQGEQPSTTDAMPVEQDGEVVSGSEGNIKLEESKTREGVAAGTSAETTTETGAMESDAKESTTAGAESESNMELDEAETREDVSEGTDAETTTETGATDSDAVEGETDSPAEIQ